MNNNEVDQLDEDLVDDCRVSDVKDIEAYNDLEAIEQESREIIEDILADGFTPDDEYEIEHLFATNDFEKLEKFAVSLFDLMGEKIDINEPEEDKEDDEVIFTFSAVSVHKLVLDEIMSDIKQIVPLCNTYGILYDGWGTNIGEE